MLERLIPLAKAPRGRVIWLLTKRRATVKRGLNARRALRYEAALKRAGCNVAVVPELSSLSPPDEPSVANTARLAEPLESKNSGETKTAIRPTRKNEAREMRIVTIGGLPFVGTL